MAAPPAAPAAGPTTPSAPPTPPATAPKPEASTAERGQPQDGTPDRCHSSSSASGVTNSTWLFRNAITSAPAAPPSTRVKLSREAWASPPCSKMASVSVVARPSCRYGAVEATPHRFSCGASRDPVVHRVSDEYGPRAFRCSACRSTTARQAEPYVADMKMNYPVLQGLGKEDSRRVWADARHCRDGADLARRQDLLETHRVGGERSLREPRSRDCCERV